MTQPCKQGDMKKVRREHRLVVLPDFQGVGQGPVHGGY